MSEEVLELSVEETNQLRAKLGLVPLRLSNDGESKDIPTIDAPTGSIGKSTQEGDEVLEMSVDETNRLREKLGLPPLRNSSSSKKQEIHKPAENEGASKELAERLADAKIRRQVQAGVRNTFGEGTLADDIDTSALSWAEQMRKQKDTMASSPSKAMKSKKNDKQGSNYSDKDLQGLQVAHNMNDLEAGATTVLTLADAPLLAETLDDQTSKKHVRLNETDIALENVNLMENKMQQDGLRKKRMLEMGMGRAGGYAGFDDEEFEELGGTLGPSKRERGNASFGGDTEGDGNLSRGFLIGGSKDNRDESASTDFDKIQMGKAVSLVSERADVAASDYMTIEEEEAERASRKKKKDSKFKKKKKKKDKKRRKTHVDSDEEDDDMSQVKSTTITNNKKNVLEQLEETAMPSTSGLRKRRRLEDADDDDQHVAPMKVDSGFVPVNNGNSIKTDNKRSNFDKIMAKGNTRTQKAFGIKTKNNSQNEVDALDDEPDDSFLNAALAKARRLNRLREMNSTASKGADAVAQAIKANSLNDEMQKTKMEETDGKRTISFAINDTREFTLALQARAQQKEREEEKAKKSRASGKASNIVKKEQDLTPDKDLQKEETYVETVEEEPDMEELAKEIKPDDIIDTGFEGSTARASGVGRGLSSFVSMLKTTGEISNKNAKEELRGRAKDERNYENYAPVDLSQVVNIGRNATELDREFANREIKLEYRDKHGRLLTTKEAYRDLCYQFHGHGASKKNEEKRLRQMEREQAQARMASQQVNAARDGTTTSTLGALKATQKATGKAFIIHKT